MEQLAANTDSGGILPSALQLKMLLVAIEELSRVVLLHASSREALSGEAARMPDGAALVQRKPDGELRAVFEDAEHSAAPPAGVGRQGLRRDCWL